MALPFSEFYGYVIDMAFRTNAAESNLLLQTEATDRIYGEDNNNDATMGHGSTMTYSTDDTSFKLEKIESLMKNIRIVFFTPDTTGSNLGTVLVYAKLDMENKTVVGTEITAPIVLYKTVNNAYSYVGADGKTAICYANEGKYYSDEKFTTEVTITDPENLTKVTEVKVTGQDAVITALNQNTATAVSVMVYLDGTNMTNADVSATSSVSLTGSMNLQFSSSAKLVPMENGALHTPDESETTAAPVTP